MWRLYSCLLLCQHAHVFSVFTRPKLHLNRFTLKFHF
uniref:Uncharacterized protein n=1 Tax=Rhizophora mucronata TaxID=61149 RepID=A0A2P2QU95_RHIMU